jgi:hypothetical protein
MYFRNLRHFLVGLLTGSKRKDDRLNSTSDLSEKKRLLHRLNCINLDEDEVECLQAYITTILEARYQNGSTNLDTTAQSNCLVLEMDEEEYRAFANNVGGNSVRLFRAMVRSSDNSTTQARKLTIVGEHGLRLFHVLVQSNNRVLQN